MASIQEYLDLIKNAIYGKDVRQAIHDGILQCYLDASGDHYERLDRNKVNQPLDNNNQPTNGTSGQLLRTKGNGATEWADVGLPTDAQTAQAVSDWLDEHPEATTTVQDHSLTYEKLVNGTLGFVTPLMFGAVGDGVTDDTDAIDKCFQSGLPINLMGMAYACAITSTYSDVQIYNGKLISSNVLTFSGNVSIDIDLETVSANGILLSGASGSVSVKTTTASASLLILEDCDQMDIAIVGTNITASAIMLNANNHNIDITVNLDTVGDSEHPAIYINSGSTAAERNTCITIHDSIISNCGAFGILASGERIVVDNVIVDTCGGIGSGIWVHDAGYVTIRNSKFLNAGRYGIYSNKSIYLLIDNCEAVGNYYSGLFLGYDSNTTPYYSGADAHKMVTVLNSYIHDNNGQGSYQDIRIEGWANVTFINCKVGQYRMYIASHASNSNMSFINCSCDSSAFFAGLTDTIAACLTFVDVYDSGGHKFSFNGKAPVVNTTYTLGTYTASRYLSYASSTTAETVLNVLATLIKDLKDKGILN